MDGQAELVVACASELAQVGSAVMIVLETNGGCVMGTSEGSIVEAGSPVFGW